MNESVSFQLLQKYGDPFERLICQKIDALHPVLYPYSRVWAEHIFPRRIGDGSEITPEWMPFGGCHYTAIIRLHHALLAKGKIIRLCKQVAGSAGEQAQDADYLRVLAVHDACASFWNNLGASIDNFVHAEEAARKALEIKIEKRKPLPICEKCGTKITSEEKTAFRTVSPTKTPLMAYAYERRTQFIHSILVPHKIDGGMIVFNLRHYDDAKTDWTTELETWQNIDSQIEKDWTSLLNEFLGEWYGLLTFLQEHDIERAVDFTSTTLASPPLSASKSEAPTGYILSGTGSCGLVPPSGTSPIRIQSPATMSVPSGLELSVFPPKKP